jgi:hypothetical protein
MFRDWIPRLKMQAFDRVSEQLRAKNPRWSDTQVGTTAAKVVNGSFGGVNWRSLGVSASSVDALRLILLAPDFTGSHLLLGKAALEGGGSVVGASMARIAAYNLLAAQALNLLFNGKVRMDHPFGVVSSDDKHVYSMRTMPSDIYRAITEPRNFFTNRLNPLTVRTGLELAEGRDNLGRQVTGYQQMLDVLRNVIPMSGQNLVGRAFPDITHGQVPSWEDVGTRALGLSISNNASPAEAEATRLASGHNETGPVDPSKLAKHQSTLQLEDRVRAGEIPWSEVQRQVEAGELSPKDADEIKKTLQTTKDVPPEGVRLYLRFNRLPVVEALKVWDVASKGEKDLVLAPLMKKKIQSFFKRSQKDMTPAERAQDPTYQLLRRRFPTADPW